MAGAALAVVLYCHTSVSRDFCTQVLTVWVYVPEVVGFREHAVSVYDVLTLVRTLLLTVPA